MSLGLIILAGGDGKRIRSSLPKVLHPLAGIPLLFRVITSAANIELIEKITVVVGNYFEQIRLHCNDYFTSKNPILLEQLSWSYQQFPLGTANAVSIGLEQLDQQIDRVLVISGDLPLISSSTINNLIITTDLNSIGLVSATVSDPYGLGRIVRDQHGAFLKIVEQADLSEQQLGSCKEINVGAYLFPKQFLLDYLPQINNNNQQKEYYLTDLLGLAVANGYQINTIAPAHSLESYSINTRKQLLELERSYQLFLANNLLEQGVTVLDPNRLDIRGEAIIEPDVEIDVNVILVGKVIIKEGAKIGANCYIKDAIIGEYSVIEPNTVIDGATIEQGAKIGPFARIRPKTNIKAYAKVGNFVEIKDSIVGEYSKINHLSYVGNTVVGKKVNIGAGTITCNYDGVNKHTTRIQDNVLIGAGCQLIAPIEVGHNATIAAGTTILQDPPSDRLTLNKKVQYSVEWERPSKQPILVDKLIEK